MTPIVFTFPGHEDIADRLIENCGFEKGDLTVRNYPDKESYVRILSDVRDKQIIIICGLENPDNKIMSLVFFTETARELRAKKIHLVAPYLGYMRQDKRFNDGEAITSNIFAGMLSKYIDSLITIDPHLHRHKSLDEIYNVPSKVLHAADSIAEWIKDNVEKPLLIGPDEESEQWVSDIAGKAKAPFIILKKIRHGDRDVEISIPEIDKYRDHTSVLVDDIISTARTMIETVKHLNRTGLRKPICVGVHAIFAGDAYNDMLDSGAEKIVTCNTIPHLSNGIDISGIIVDSFKALYLK